MSYINLIGAIAAIYTTISFLPQAVRIHRTKKTHDISLPMYVILSFGILMWIYYGIMTRSLPIIAANVLTFFFCLYIMAMKITYK